MFKLKTHFEEAIKWGIIAGIIEGIFCLLIALLWINQEKLLKFGPGWELEATIIAIGLFTLSFIISSILIFAEPITLIIQKRFDEAKLTFLITLVTLIVIFSFIILGYKTLF